MEVTDEIRQLAARLRQAEASDTGRIGLSDLTGDGINSNGFPARRKSRVGLECISFKRMAIRRQPA